MEQLVLQSDTNSLSSIEDFLGAICEDNHLEKYHAVISVSVMQAADYALCLSGKEDQVVLKANHCKGGFSFQLEAPHPCFGIIAKNPQSDLSVLISSLVDDFTITNNGTMLQLIFHIQGIDAGEASHRAKVLTDFYGALHASQLQFQLNEN